MKPEEIPDEIVRAAVDVLTRPSVYQGSMPPMAERTARGVLAAAWPLIAKAERERCADIADKYAVEYDGGAYDGYNVGAASLKELAQTFRALEDTR